MCSVQLWKSCMLQTKAQQQNIWSTGAVTSVLNLNFGHKRVISHHRIVYITVEVFSSSNCDLLKMCEVITSQQLLRLSPIRHRLNHRMWASKLMEKSLKTCILSQSQQGVNPLVAERSPDCMKAYEKMIYYLSKQLPHEFMVPVTSFKSASAQHDVQLVN